MLPERGGYVRCWTNLMVDSQCDESMDVVGDGL